MPHALSRSLALAVLAALLLGGSGATGGNARRLGGHVLGEGQLRGARHLGRHAGNRRVTLSVSLGLRDPAGLRELLHGLYDPQDPRYHQFLTPEQFRDRHAPTEDDVARLSDYLSQRGLAVTGVHPNRLVVNVEGASRDVENAFQVELHDYRTEDGRVAFAPSAEPLLLGDAAEQVIAVTGLSTFSRRRPAPHRVGARIDTNAAPNATAHKTINDYMTPSKIRTAYNMGSVSANGSGETLALFELDGYDPADVTAYANQFGLTVPTLQNVLVDGYSGAAGSDAMEVCLDIQVAMAMAPGLAKIMVYEGPNTDSGVLNTYSRIASDNQAKVVSTSWGLAENLTSASSRNAENTIFQQLAAQGQSIFAASGDSGAYDDSTHPSDLHVDDPASQPYVTAVGGTRLNANATTGAYISETSWNNGGTQGGGGGISQVWAQPSWQSGLGTSTNKGSLSTRMVPDVSLDADPDTGYAIRVGGSWYAVGGTSAAAPLWAAYTTVVNQARVANGLSRIGFISPSLYQIGQSSAYASSFHDIADGSTNRYYPAVAGYDLSTGLGTLNGAGLFAILSGNVLPPSAPTSLSIIAGPSSVTLSWAGGSGATSYKVYRAASAAGAYAAISSGSAATTYVDSSAVGLNYYYVTAVNSAGESSASPVQSGAANQAPPAAPTNLAGTVIP